ncbi:hypothetical protein MPSEU_000978500 [Mayamaea pseudoterrestris]|nr:hypothetical protein MPSEU_000978500 [Mayamaea pseudoterrestris]
MLAHKLLSSTRDASRKTVLVTRLRASSRAVVTNSPEDATDASPTQSFVQARIQAGEWDPERTDPLYRPKFKSRAKILSLDDFANRPAVGFSGEFKSFQDAMVTLSWIDSKQQEQIYQLYIELQKHASDKHGVTSHDYITRVIAQKFNLTQERIAAIIQLQHNEQQYKREGRTLLTEAASYMDAAIQQEIREAYQTFDLKQPDEFVEDPVGVTGELQERKQWQVVEDVFDVDQLLADATIREDREARLAIDGHHYMEDVDDDAIEIPTSKDAKRLLKRHEKLQSASPKPSDAIEWPAPASGEKRSRWKFVAQVVNTRDLKRQHKPNRSYTNNSPENTLVEQDGTLRVGTMADVKHASWKPTRNVREHIYAGVKKGWLDRNIRGVETAWGRAPNVPVQPNVAPVADVSPADEPTAAMDEVSDAAAADSVDSSDNSNVGDDNSGSEQNTASDSAKEK